MIDSWITDCFGLLALLNTLCLLCKSRPIYIKTDLNFYRSRLIFTEWIGFLQRHQEMMADERSYRFIWKIVFLAVVFLDVQMVFVEGEEKSTDSTGEFLFYHFTTIFWDLLLIWIIFGFTHKFIPKPNLALRIFGVFRSGFICDFLQRPNLVWHTYSSLDFLVGFRNQKHFYLEIKFCLTSFWSFVSWFIYNFL